MGVYRVFVLNCGSSSIKFQMIAPDSGQVFLKGIVENVETSRAILKWSNGQRPLKQSDYASAIDAIVSFFKEERVDAIGHRVVHGGERFTDSVKIDSSVLTQIEACVPLAPLHNPFNLLGIKRFHHLFPHLSQVAVFDTSFHQTLPEKAYLYPIPYNYYKEYGVRRYGFHGISHRFVVEEGAKKLGKSVEETSFISCHLGNGCSLAAIQNGKSIDTSMGLTPLEGLMMGQRSGDIDPSLVAFFSEHLNLSAKEFTEILNKKSGLAGVSEISGDMRILLKSRDKQARLAIEMFCYRLAKYIAAYLVPLKKVDGVIFTGGIGENAEPILREVKRELAPFRLNFFVIPTNEEWMIAQDTARIVRVAT